MKVEDINVDNILLDEKSYENVSVYNVLYEKFMDVISLRISFNKVNGMIKIYDGVRYLEVSNLYNEVHDRINCRIYNAIFDRINCDKSDDKYSINHNFSRIRIDSYNSLSLEKNSLFIML